MYFLQQAGRQAGRQAGTVQTLQVNKGGTGTQSGQALKGGRAPGLEPRPSRQQLPLAGARQAAWRTPRGQVQASAKGGGARAVLLHDRRTDA